MRKRVFATLLLSTAAAFAAAPVSSVSSLSLGTQVKQLRNQVKYLQSQFNQLPELKKSIDSLRGQNETLVHNVKTLQESNKLLMARVVRLEAGSNLSTAHNASTSKSAKTSNEYEKAYALINQNRYDSAIKALNAYLKRYPKGKHASDAQYWLGELYLVKGKPDQASRAFRSVAHNPNALKAPDALRQLGTIYLANGDSAHAKKTFTKVINDYPGTAAAKLAKKQLDSMK